MIVFYGHAETDKLYAHGTLAQAKDPAIDLNNAHLLQDKIIYAVACQSAKKLGDDAVNTHGAKVYVGYEEKLWFVFGGPEYWFRRTVNEMLLEHLEQPGVVCRDTFDHMGETYDAAIAYYQTGGGVGHYNAGKAIQYLQDNKRCLRLLGDQNETF
ncbi:MAG: hypothetical protein ACKVVP_15920 [Chloroflexota bacterium]